jgi:DNA mismatch repair ATPase MutL
VVFLFLKPIEVSASEEQVILDHLPVFAFNGFHFKVNGSSGTGTTGTNDEDDDTTLPAAAAAAAGGGDDDGGDGDDDKNKNVNGDDFEINNGENSCLPGRRLSISKLPYSKSTVFNDDDIHELASLLSENPWRSAALDGNMPRLPKLRSMFASRACRSAVMIGTALDKLQMLRIVKKLEDIDQPWNCPHGRPTMRHLSDLRTMKIATSISED